MSGGLTTVQLYYFMELYGDAMLTAAYDKFGLVFLANQLGTPEDFAYTAKGMELNTLADVKKLKMRTAGIGGEIMTKLGASTVFLPGGELYESMQRGVINAFEYSGAANFWDMKFQEVTGNLYLSDARAPSDANAWFARKESWTPLPDDLKNIILWIQRGSEQLSWTRALNANGVALQKIKDYGIKVQNLPKEIDDAFRTTATQYFDAEAAKYGADSLYAKTVKAMRDFKKVCDAQNAR
jgi:TRAP-type mannitol/chloroaromatic compound transport system substrate-binding protein